MSSLAQTRFSSHYYITGFLQLPISRNTNPINLGASSSNYSFIKALSHYQGNYYLDLLIN